MRVEALAGSSCLSSSCCACAMEGQGHYKAHCSERFLRAAFVTKSKCPRVFQNNGAAEDSRLSNLRAVWVGWEELSQELDVPQLCV